MNEHLRYLYRIILAVLALCQAVAPPLLTWLQQHERPGLHEPIMPIDKPDRWA